MLFPLELKFHQAYIHTLHTHTNQTYFATTRLSKPHRRTFSSVSYTTQLALLHNKNSK
jgi:hypothetical protein